MTQAVGSDGREEFRNSWIGSQTAAAAGEHSTRPPLLTGHSTIITVTIPNMP